MAEHIQWQSNGIVIENMREGNKENGKGGGYETETGNMLMRE